MDRDAATGRRVRRRRLARAAPPPLVEDRETIAWASVYRCVAGTRQRSHTSSTKRHSPRTGRRLRAIVATQIFCPVAERERGDVPGFFSRSLKSGAKPLATAQFSPCNAASRVLVRRPTFHPTERARRRTRRPAASVDQASVDRGDVDRVRGAVALRLAGPHLAVSARYFRT